MKKKYIKSDFKAIIFKPATNGQKDKGFLLTSTFVRKGLTAPALGLYTCIKALKYIPGPVSGERLQDHWSSGPLCGYFVSATPYTISILSSCYFPWFEDVHVVWI